MCKAYALFLFLCLGLTTLSNYAIMFWIILSKAVEGMKRKAVFIACGFFFGAFVSFYLDVCELITFMAALLICALASLLLPEKKRRYFLLTITFAILASGYNLVYTSIALDRVETYDGEMVEVTGIVCDYTEGDSSQIIVKGKVNGTNCKVIAYVNDFSGELGDRVSFIGKISKISDTPFFKARSYYLPDNIFATVSVSDDIAVEKQTLSLATKIRLFSKSASQNIRSSVGGDAGDLLAAMVCGDSSHISSSLRLKLNRAGVGHIGAVSGLHLTVVAASLMLLLRKLRCLSLISAIVCEGAVLAFVVFSGTRVSCIRAAIMMSVYILSTVVKRRGDPLNTLSIAALLIMLSSPYAVVDVSFCLSVSGAFGVSIASPYAIKLLKAKNAVVKAFILCACANICIMPFIILNFNEISLIAPIINMIAVPICSVALVLGMLFVILGAGPAMSWLAIIAGKLIAFVIELCEAVSELSLAYMATGRIDTYLFISFIVIALSIAAFIIRKKKAIAFAMLMCFCLFVGTSAYKITNDDSLSLDILTSSGNSCAVLRNGGECIIIDLSGGKMADECEGYIEKQGIDSVDAIMIAKNGESAYSSYLDLSVSPDIMLLPKDSYIYGGEIASDAIPDVLDAYGCSIRLQEDFLHISNDEMSIAVSVADYYESGAYVNVCLLDSLCVVNAGGEATIYKDDNIISLKLN